VHPKDFGRGRPRLLTLPEQWGEVTSRYRGLGPSSPLEWIFEHATALGAASVLLEHQYLDRDYRDEYRQFYANTFRWVPDRCERLHFWDAEDRYIGYTSLRPIAGRPVGRTMLAPGEDFDRDVSCLAEATARPYGHTFKVRAFPYISQDRQYGRCAHATIWMIAQYHHLRFGSPQRLMSDIVDAAAQVEFERVVPSEGLTDDQVGAAFRCLDLGAIRYTVGGREGITREDLEAKLRRYLNSGMPLALSTPGHLTTIIGGGYEDGELKVVSCDDEQGVYVRRSITFPTEEEADPGFDGELDPKVWEILFVPLPGRIYAPYEALEAQIMEELSELSQRYVEPGALTGSRLRLREYVAEVREYKSKVRRRGLPAETAEAHAQVPSGRWLWVCEIQDADLAETSPHCVLGEIAVDATSDRDDLVYLFANLPGIRVSWPGERRGREVMADSAQNFEPYLTGTALNL
jgi:hypothetical protein